MFEFQCLAMLKAENPEAYKKLAEKGIMVGHSVKIGGQENRGDIGIPYHTTVKFFNPDQETPEAIHNVARNLSFHPPDPKQTGIEPGVFKDRLGNDVYVVKLHGEHANKIKENNNKFSHMGYPAQYEFTPHVSVDKQMWDKIVASKAKTAHEAGMEFGPAQLMQGHNVLATYRHQAQEDVADSHKVLDSHPKPEKLAASEKMDGSLGKSNYGPAGMHLYNANDNARRKMNRTSETIDAAGPNKAVKSTTTSLKQQAENEAKEAKLKSKANPVRIYTQAEKRAFAKKTGQAVAKPTKMAASEKQPGSGLKNTAAAAAMALAIGANAPQANSHYTDTPDNNAQSNYDKNKMLNAIAQVESTGGKFASHRMLAGINQGESAYGKYGLTPNVIRETVRMHPEFKAHKKLATLKGQDLAHYMQDNPQLENEVASKHLDRLEHHFGQDPGKLSYAWLNGIQGTYKAAKENTNINEHWHVKKVKHAYGSN